MNNHFDNVPYIVTISDAQGVILYMNRESIATFSDNGVSLVGRNLSEFHGPRAKQMIDNMLSTGQPNTYTIEKRGAKKIIHQAPWYDDNGNICGLIELSIKIPFEMPHYVR